MKIDKKKDVREKEENDYKGYKKIYGDYKNPVTGLQAK